MFTTEIKSVPRDVIFAVPVLSRYVFLLQRAAVSHAMTMRSRSRIVVGVF